MQTSPGGVIRTLAVQQATLRVRFPPFSRLLATVATMPGAFPAPTPLLAAVRWSIETTSAVRRTMTVRAGVRRLLGTRHEPPGATDPVGLVGVGYQGRTLPALVEHLHAERVSVLVDVRLTPWSRKPGFSKKALSGALADAGIEYLHAPALGNPRDNRQPFHDGELAVGIARFTQHIATAEGEQALDELADLARARRVAVLCFEAEEAACHRQVVLSSALARRGAG